MRDAVGAVHYSTLRGVDDTVSGGMMFLGSLLVEKVEAKLKYEPEFVQLRGLLGCYWVHHAAPRRSITVGRFVEGQEKTESRVPQTVGETCRGNGKNIRLSGNGERRTPEKIRERVISMVIRPDPIHRITASNSKERLARTTLQQMHAIEGRN